MNCANTTDLGSASRCLNFLPHFHQQGHEQLAEVLLLNLTLLPLAAKQLLLSTMLCRPFSFDVFRLDTLCKDEVNINIDSCNNNLNGIFRQTIDTAVLRLRIDCLHSKALKITGLNASLQLAVQFFCHFLECAFSGEAL